jgi:hypothetical protein
MDVSDSTRHAVGCSFGCDNKCMGKIMNPWAPEPKQWGDKSIYHYELMSFYGLLDLCRKHGTLKRTNIHLGIFSSQTNWGKTLEQSKRTALKPQFGSTNIYKKDVDELFKGRGNLIIMESDGEIFNWGGWYQEPEKDENDNVVKEGITIREKFIEGAKMHYFAYLQFGSPNSVSRDLEDAGLRVYYDRAENASKIVIDFATPLLTKQGTQ